MGVKDIRKKFIVKYGSQFDLISPSSASGVKARLGSKDSSDPLVRDSVVVAEFPYDTSVVNGSVLVDSDDNYYLVVSFVKKEMAGVTTHFSAELYKCNALASIQRKSIAQGVMGGVGAATYEDLFNDVPCFVSPAGVDINMPRIGLFNSREYVAFLSSFDIEVKKGDFLFINENRYSVEVLNSITHKNCYVLTLGDSK